MQNTTTGKRKLYFISFWDKKCSENETLKFQAYITNTKIIITSVFFVEAWEINKYSNNKKLQLSGMIQQS